MKLKVFVTAIAAVAAALLYTTTAGAPNRPPPSSCPAGYSKDSGSTDSVLLCSKIVTRDVVRDVVREVQVPGPERIVEKIVPGPERVVTKVIAKRGKTRVVYRYKTKVVRKVVRHTRFIPYCEKKHNGDKIAG